MCEFDPALLAEKGDYLISPKGRGNQAFIYKRIFTLAKNLRLFI